MKRLLDGPGDNSAAEYDRIFFERATKPADWFDRRRWKTLLKHYKGGSLIDLGCLDSLVPLWARERDPSANIWAIDAAPQAMAVMGKILPDINYAVGDVYKLDFVDNVFDHCIMGEVLEHAQRPGDMIKEALRVLRPSGILAISVPLNEHLEIGAVDKDRHVFSYCLQDFKDLSAGLGEVFDSKVLRSRWFPTYRYSWPTLIVWIKKYVRI